ncbi:DNA repair protein RAD51 homolog 4 isoform X1 [Apus apus]|uniref:DNA repair protein RAD51 homolog 4 isoform X1 n=1 Tax=Apus apus TaxID=8895 RepID=UPI0021F8B44B|nr:DNA repair protein RAD51 homolog 4 isoform X1 [Apus apus]
MTPKSWYVNQGAQSCSAHSLDRLVWRVLLQQTWLAQGFLSPISRHLSAHQALVAVRRVLLAQFSAFPANGADLYEELKSSTAILSTGSPSLDQLLDSGLYTGEVTELMGAPGSGKTQVCLSIAASVSLGLKQHVVFLDSTGGFTASRLYQMLQARAEDEGEQLEALQRIQVVRVFHIYELLRALQELRDRLSQQALQPPPPRRCSPLPPGAAAPSPQALRPAGPLKILVLDSVSAVVYPLLGGKQSEGLAIMMQLARELKTLAREFSLAVVVTNQVTRDSSTGLLKPALGRSWSFVPSTRVLLESKEATWEKATWEKATTQRIASLAKSPRQPTGIQVELDIGNVDVQELSPARPTTPTQGL